MPLRMTLLLAALLAFALPARATDVIGNLNTSQHWTTAGSPYKLLGDVTVAPLATLTIDAGVVVEAQASDQMGAGNAANKVEFVVQGTLVANGTTASPIVFRGAAAGRDGWYGLSFDVGAKSSQLTNVRITDAMTALWVRATAAQALSDVFIGQSTTGVLWQTTTAMALDRFEISFPRTYGIRIEDGGAGGVTATVAGAFIYVGDPASVGISVATRVTATVKRSRIIQVGTGVKADTGSALTLVNSVVAGCYANGVQVAQAGSSAFNLSNNTIDRNSYSGAASVGLLVESVSSAPTFIVRNNLLTNNGTGLKVVGVPQPSHDTNDVWGNTANYTGTTAAPTSISTNPLYVQPMAAVAPANATWLSGGAFAVAAGSSYGTNSSQAELPGASLLRLRNVSYGHAPSSIATVYDRLGATLASWTASVTGGAVGPLLGNFLRGTEYTTNGYSGYGWSGALEYVGPGVWNYRLQSSSPAIDKGNDLGAPTEDADATRRPVDGDVNGTLTTDLGAYEFHDNYPPVVNAGLDRTVKPGDTVAFDAAGTADPDGTIVTWDWDFGDASTHATVQTTSHAFATVGDYTVKLTVTDNLGLSASDSAVVHVKNNLPPTASAGPDQNAVIGTAVNFDGRSSTDLDGTITSYDWDFGDSTPHSNNPSTGHTYARNGVFTATLVVTDNQGATGTDSAFVVVGNGTSTNHAPVASAGASQTVALGAAVTLSGAGSTDADGAADIASYSWDFGDGSAKGAGVSVAHTYAAGGTFIVTLTVTDKAGATGNATAAVTVTAPTNRPPQARAGGPYSALVGVSVAFDGSASTDADGTIALYSWDFGDGSSGTGAKPAHTYATAGSNLVRLTVTDDKGATNTDSVLASIVAPNNRPPVANAGGPYAASVGAAVLFDGSKSADPDGSVASFHWDFGDGAQADGDRTSHTFTAGGSFLVRLTVSDDRGASDDDAVLATISVPGNQPPVAKAGGNRSAHVAESVVFDAAASTDADGRVAAYAWDFGDGSTAATSRATHAYPEAGSYLVKLTVTDDKGAIGQDIALVSVGAQAQGNQAPIARAGSDVHANVGQKVVFNAAGSTDPDGTIVAYQWDFGDGDTAAGLSSAHTYDAAGTYTATLTVFDDKGARATSTLTAYLNGLPVPDFGDDRTAKVGQTLTFDASASTDDGTIVANRWSFGDGGKADGATVTHAYAAAGSYTVTLELTDDAGAKALGKVKVTVDEQTQSVPAPTKSGCGCSEPGVGFSGLVGFASMLLGVARRRRGV